MKERFIYKRKKKLYLLILIGCFFLSSSIGGAIARTFAEFIPLEDINAHFSPTKPEDIREYLSLFTSSFYDDGFDVLYLFVLSFTAFGKPVSIGIISLRGAKFGYYFVALTNTLSEYGKIFSYSEYVLWFLFELAVNFLIVMFSREEFVFGDETKEFYPHRIKIIATRRFLGYFTDTVLICGAIALLRIVYTLFIIII